eukprot:GHUV01047744.1.p1 GENE.GHUV01047744.1~~GHUV01047744.1.p1  ORF type:complete len:170 (-),score=46.35 GHUV01047744.1:199-708(-)
MAQNTDRRDSYIPCTPLAHLAPSAGTQPYPSMLLCLQVCYGVTIVSFLGAVHWGVAMSSSLSGPVAARIANEGFVYSVIPSLCAWPAALMEPGAGAVVLSILLPACYGADYGRRNIGLPQWYMALRLPLTLLATFGMLLTATRHVHAQLDYAKELTQREKDKAATAATK